MSKEERLTWKAEKEKREEERIQSGHEKVKGFLSSFNVADPTRKNEEEKGAVGKSTEKVGEWYNKTFGNVTGIFKESHYDVPDIPEERINSYLEHPDGTIEPVDITPEIVKPWVCNYYYLPRYRARLAISIFVIIGVIFMISLAATFDYTWHTIAALALSSLLLINVAARYLGLAIYKLPMPKIPWVSDLRIYRQPEEEEYDEDVTYEEVLDRNSDSIPVVEPVERYNGDSPSPATLLTRWMNGVARMSENDLIDQSGGALDSLRVKLLLRDDEDAWMDFDTVDVLSKITGSRPQQWRDAWYEWYADNE